MNLRLPFRFPLVAFIISLSLFTLISFSTFSQASVLTGYKGMRWVGNIGTATATDSPQTFATYEEAYAYTAAHASDHMTPAGGSYGAYTWASASLEQQSYYNYTQLSGSTYITSWYYTQVFPSPYGSVGGAGTWPTSENDICGNFSADIKESKIGGVGGHYRHGPVNEVALTNTAERSLGGSPCVTPIGVTPYWQVHKSWDFSIKEVYDEPIKVGKELGPCPDCGGNPTLSSNPIHLASGNKYKAQTDFVGSGDFPLVIARYYNSNSFGDIGMGNQWRHHYDRYITKAPNSSLNIAYVHRHNGRVLDYTKNVSTGLWVPDADINEILTPVMSGPTQTGWTLTLSDDSVETYNIAGDLLSIKTRAGLTQTLSYDTARRITTVTDDFNHTLTFAYDINSRVSTITNTKGEVFTYTYATNGNLTNITFPAIGGVSKFKTYRYENTAFAFNLTGITDEKGVSFETYTYDANGLAITSEIATGVNKIAVDFSTVGNGASYVTVTDALNVARPVNFTTVLKSRRNAGTTTTPSVDSALKFNNISI